MYPVLWTVGLLIPGSPTGKGKRPARPLKGLSRTQWLIPVVGIRVVTAALKGERLRFNADLMALPECQGLKSPVPVSEFFGSEYFGGYTVPPPTKDDRDVLPSYGALITAWIWLRKHARTELETIALSCGYSDIDAVDYQIQRLRAIWYEEKYGRQIRRDRFLSFVAERLENEGLLEKET